MLILSEKVVQAACKLSPSHSAPMCVSLVLTKLSSKNPEEILVEKASTLAERKDEDDESLGPKVRATEHKASDVNGGF